MEDATPTGTESAEQSLSCHSWEGFDAGSMEWDPWEENEGQTANPDPRTPPVNQTPDPCQYEFESGQSSAHTSLWEDDGGRRCRNRRPLRCCPEAFTASGQELEQAVAEGIAGKGKRKRRRNKDMTIRRCGRGPGKCRDAMHPDDRP